MKEEKKKKNRKINKLKNTSNNNKINNSYKHIQLNVLAVSLAGYQKKHPIEQLICLHYLIESSCCHLLCLIICLIILSTERRDFNFFHS